MKPIYVKTKTSLVWNPITYRLGAQGGTMSFTIEKGGNL